ncbi:MAG: PEP-utilizing enzyme [Firmicutes bacterium]|nr:PEP-utilizing enzyme [Bacillota bacterium]
MKKINFGELDNDYINRVGGKARGLHQLVTAGFNIPDGFILSEVNLENDLDTALEYYKKSNFGNVAIRSSASTEDGADFSYAGQFVTVLNVNGEQQFKDAIRRCVESLDGVASKTYRDQVGGKKRANMSVVVQKMIETDIAGVCFTSNPQDKNKILIETVRGLGEQLVSGTTKPTTYNIAKLEIDSIANQDPLLSIEQIQQICNQSLRMKDILKTELDLEWGIKGGELYWFQVRPITVTEICESDEFNPKQDLTGQSITRCNISEMLPGAVTPLSIYTSVLAIDWGIRKMLMVSGANKKMRELEPFSCALSAHGHLFLNLSTMFRMTKTTYLAKTRDVELSICNRYLNEEERGIIPGKKPWFFARLINSFKYIRFIMSSKKAKKRIAELSDNFTIEDNASTSQELYDAIIQSQNTANQVAYLHYVTSGHSGAMSSATTNALNKKFNDREKSRAVLAQMLERIDGIESVDILASLCRLANAIVEDNPMARNYTAEQLINYLETTNQNVKTVYNEFMSRHGHRAIREAELRSKGWSSDNKAFAQFLRTVIQGDMPEPVKQAPPNLKDIVREHGFKGTKARMLVYYANQARDGVRNREFSKSKLIKVFDVFKQAYTKLANQLVANGRLPDEDSIFFLTPDEIGKLVKDENATLVKKALQRRNLLKSQSELSFAEVYANTPQPLEQQGFVESGNVLYGTPVSRGRVVGTARVVKCVEDAAQLQKGEIMVASFTDIGWSPFYCLIDGLITEVGGALSHGAVVAREYALPLVSNITGATVLINTGDKIILDGYTGTVQKIEHTQ